MVRRVGRRPEQLDVVDQPAARPGDPVRLDRLPDAPRHVGQPIDVAELDRLAVVGHQEEPVPAPGDVTGHGAVSRHLDRHALAVAVARHVPHGHPAVGVERRGDGADRRLDAVGARADAAHVGERDDQPDGAVAAHPERADVVEEDDARGAGRVVRLAQQRADEHVRPARLVDDARPE